MINKLIDKLKLYFIKYREEVVYIFFGGLTTVVYTIAYTLCREFFTLPVGYSTNIAWVIAVIFAYITNKIWVFEVRNYNLKSMAKEFILFVYARLLSQAINYLIMVGGVEKFNINEWFVLIFAQIIVVLFNYFASKWFVFKKNS